MKDVGVLWVMDMRVGEYSWHSVSRGVVAWERGVTASHRAERTHCAPYLQAVVHWLEAVADLSSDLPIATGADSDDMVRD